MFKAHDSDRLKVENVRDVFSPPVHCSDIVCVSDILLNYN